MRVDGQDVGHKHYLSSYGGWGFAHVLTLFKGMMERGGISPEWHDQITRKNPRRMLTGVAAKTDLRLHLETGLDVPRAADNESFCEEDASPDADITLQIATFHPRC